MIRLGETDYRLCLLDTNAVSEMVKRPKTLRHFLTWALGVSPKFIPCFSLFTILELRRSNAVYAQFIEGFGPLPCMILKSHEQLLEEEVRLYPDPSAIDPTLLGFSGPLGGDGNDLRKVLPHAFGTRPILEHERAWNDGQDEIVQGIGSLVANFPPEGDTYTAGEIRLFLEVTALQQLVMRAPGFAEQIIGNDEVFDVDAFPSLKATGYTVFHKFYSDRTRKPTRSDAFDIIIAAATPYVEAIIQAAAERFHRAEAKLGKAREELRAAMAAAHDEGVPTARLAREAGISRPTAHEWLKRR
jgi:hypothetical protein